MRDAPMLDHEIYAKTDAGREEIRSRALGLPMAARAILLMVDGQRTVGAMRTLIAGSKAPADVLDGLAARGLIEPRVDPLAVARPPAVEAPVAPPIAPPAPPPQPPAPIVTAPATVAAPSLIQRATEVAAASSFRGEAFATDAPPLVVDPHDGPLDLVLPTIVGDEPAVKAAEPALQAVVAEAEPPPVDAPVGRNRYEHLYSMMNEIVRDFLAPHRRYFFQLKIERCTTAEDLLELLHDLQTALSKARGDAFATDVIARLRSAVG